ncbi:2-hydroxycarboxylate transporter family protein [Brevibacterium aurantiacum]|uniref:2-hydroxycarboxylate transporter family protein n=1 Tax=Brevibacterium aurantiacum TaxID=273384 RepID=A0A556C919_BREAU|nr:2-hydroxycarboxylate transporter family protein [Brevibacterium aurantiacum]TSI13826.1 2-hydroxycarboxylate transporter family protein [Brevibacterium aurantiacum]
MMSEVRRPAHPETEATAAPALDSSTGTRRKRDLLRIAGMPYLYFGALFITFLVAALTDNLPDSMLVGFGITVVLGGALMAIGQSIPKVRDYGLPTLLCTFVPAILIYAGVMPDSIPPVVTNFLDGYGFLDFFVVAVIAGSVLGMPRALLLKAGPRFLIPLLGCIVITFLVIGGISAILGFGFIKGILFVAGPIMAGGLGIGAVPMSQMYAAQTGTDASVFMADLMAALVIGNIFCIIFAGLLNGLGRSGRQWFVGFNGDGELMRVKGRKNELSLPEKKSGSTFQQLGIGVAIAAGLFILGTLLGAIMPFLHPYAWTIIAAALIKIFGLFPRELEEASTEWGELMTSYFLPALLVTVSITYIDINEVVGAISDPIFMGLTVLTVISAGLVAGVLGWLLKFNFVEAAITPGLVMADTGGSGDVAVLSAANRIHLMPFAALSTRLGGAVNLFIVSLLVPFLHM